MNTFQRSSLAATVAMLLCPSLSAFAQEAPADTESADDALEVITVNARKRTETLQDVPLSITAMGMKDIEALGADRMRDLEHAVPNMMFDGANQSSKTAIGIRGIYSNARNVGFESGVGVYVDGVFMGRPMAFNQEMPDVVQMEVLRGPQGTLFGKNTMAGAINITTSEPTDVPTAKVSIKLGNYDLVETSAIVSGGLTDNLSGKVVGFYADRDGYEHNVYNDTYINDEHYWGSRAQLHYTPTEDLTIDLRADYMNEDHSPNFGEVLDTSGSLGQYVEGLRTHSFDTVNNEKRELWGASLTADYRISDALSLKSITSYRTADRSFINEEDYGTTPYSMVGLSTETFDVKSQEFQVSGVGDNYDWVAGVHLYHQVSEAARPLAGGYIDLLMGAADSVVGNEVRVETSSYAVFFHTNYNLTDALTLIAGARYTYEEKASDYEQTGQQLGLLEVPLRHDELDDSDISPTVGLQYKFSKDLNFYTTVSKGFKSGGYNADFLTSVALDQDSGELLFEFEPESLVNYEAGAKGTFLDGRLRASLTAFLMDYEDMQVFQTILTDEGTLGLFVTNAGSATSQGLEAEFSFQLSHELRMNFGGGYTDATYDDFATLTCDGGNCAGNQLIQSPKYTISTGLNWEHEFGNGGVLVASAHYSYRAKRYRDAANEDELPGYGLVGGRIGYLSANGNWDIFLEGDNLTNKDYLMYYNVSSTAGALGAYGAPRMWGAKFTYHFE